MSIISVNRALKASFLVFYVAFISKFASCEVKRPRGVSLSKASLYQEGSEFHCFDGSQTIPFERINDDYCDCPDASDEPGTSACPNGSFHCTNAGYKPMYIPSSWVNDGVCDCCDGTDEFASGSTCENTCKELGRQLREDMEKEKVLREEGYKIFQDYSKQGQEARTEKEKRKQDLEQTKEDLKAQRDALEAVKNEREAPANEAKKKHEEAWEEEKQKKQEESDKQKVGVAFDELDANKDGQVTIAEMQRHVEFDIDSNGEVAPEEAKEYLEDQEAVSSELFAEKIWPNIKEIYKTPEEQQQQPDEDKKGDQAATDNQSQQPPNDDDEDDDNDDDDEEDDDKDRYDEEDLDDLEEEEFLTKKRFHRHGDVEEASAYDSNNDNEQLADEKDDTPEEKMPDYDAETQALIEEAEKAKKEFDEADNRHKEVEREMDELNNLLTLDLGDFSQFYPLRGECYEFTDSQYTYKLCPFDRTSQRSKSGGSETSLGRWGKWDGPKENQYSVMKYDRGQNCWNGPDRSCKVIMECGLKNELLAAAEPNRCEYEFRFATPALCSNPPSASEYDSHAHTEL